MVLAADYEGKRLLALLVSWGRLAWCGTFKLVSVFSATAVSVMTVCWISLLIRPWIVLILDSSRWVYCHTFLWFCVKLLTTERTVLSSCKCFLNDWEHWLSLYLVKPELTLFWSNLNLGLDRVRGISGTFAYYKSVPLIELLTEEFLFRKLEARVYDYAALWLNCNLCCSASLRGAAAVTGCRGLCWMFKNRRDGFTSLFWDDLTPSSSLNWSSAFFLNQFYCVLIIRLLLYGCKLLVET